ncbi:MAG TPA: hypothetical protein ENN23_03130 [Deltaproteobacteria bacterium]|nr:hypothetical protein [Deltaproteobacteria bacterium]
MRRKKCDEKKHRRKKIMRSGNVRKFELRLKKSGLIVVIVGMASLLFIVFLLGVNVGKNIDTYPEKISSLPRRILSYITKPAKIDHSQVIAEKQNLEEESEKADLDLTYHETLTDKTKVTRKPVLQKQAEKPPHSNDLNEIKSTDIKEKKKSEEVAFQKYVVHAASFQDLDKAYILNKKIAELGYEPIIIPVEIKDKGKWYRVLIRGIESKEMAQSAADKISNITSTECIIKAMD